MTTLLRRLAAALALTTAVAVAAVACETSDDDAVVVLAASSLVDVVADLADEAGQEVLVSDAGSQVLAAQLRGGADAGVVLLADPSLATDLQREGLVLDPHSVATNRLVIAVARRAADEIDALDDLAEDGRRIVLADVGVPLGDATREALDRATAAGLLASPDDVLDNVVSFEDAARVVLAKVATDEVEAAIVYATDALAAADRVTAVPWPAEAQVEVDYTVQLVSGAGPTAERFHAFVRSDEARDIWREHGFEVR